MARKFLTAIDLAKNELQNARVQNLSGAPGTPVTGQLYYNSTDNTLYWYNGAGWVAAKDAGATSIYNQTIREDGTARAQRGSINFVDSTSVAFTATDNSGSDSTDITAAPLYGSITAQTSFGAASNNGSAATLARSDHTHGTPTHDNAAHAAINLSALAAPTADVSWGNFKITSLAAPTTSTDAATKAYVDSVAQGLTDFKPSVRVASTTNGTLASAFQNGSAVDGVTLATGDRILIKAQSTSSENGIYTVNATGAPTRATDMDASGELSVGTLVYVESGTVNGGQQWLCSATTATPWVPGSSGSTWIMYFAVTATQAGAGLTASANVLAVGAGTGISVAADAVSIDTALVARKYVIPTFGGSTSQLVTHNLNSQDILVMIRQVSDQAVVDCGIVATSVNTCTLSFDVAPAASSLKGLVVA